MDVLEDKGEKLFNKYIYTAIESAINVYKYAGLMKQGSLSIEKSRIIKVLKSCNFNLNAKGYETVLNNFKKSKYHKRCNDLKIELTPKNHLYSGDTIYHSRTLQKNKNFTLNDFKKLAIELLFASPILEEYSTPLQYTTTLKRVGKLVGLQPCTINYHTRGYLKLIKFQFITKEQHEELLALKQADKTLPYSFIVHTNQKEMTTDENGEFKDNAEYYLTPIGSRLFTNKKFKSLDRTGECLKVNFLELNKKVREGDKFKQTFVSLTDDMNLVNLMDNIERQRVSHESISTDSNENSNIFEIDKANQIQIVYKDYNSAKATVQQIVAILGMIKNLSSCDINIPEFNWNQKFYKLDALIRFFAKRMFETQLIDDEVLQDNLKTFRKIIDRTRALQGSKRHIKKWNETLRIREITEKNRCPYLDLDKDINEIFSSFFKNKNPEIVGEDLDKDKNIVSLQDDQFFNLSLQSKNKEIIS